MFKNYKIKKIPIRGKTYTLWIADTDEKRKKGLSGIKSLPKGTGMLFVYDDYVDNPFTMKNTHIPLTLLFLDDKFEIIDIQKGFPNQTALIRPSKKYVYVIEI